MAFDGTDQALVFVTCQVRVAIEQRPGRFLGLLEQFAVAVEIGQPEGWQAMLAGPEKITWTPQFKVLADLILSG